MNREEDTDVEVVVVEINEEERSRKSRWRHNLFYGTISAILPIALSYGIMSKLREIFSWQDLLAILVLLLIVLALVMLSIGQRFRERSYLRDWKARQERSRLMLHDQGRSATNRSDGQAAGKPDEMVADELDEASLENRLLRSLGMDPGR